MVEAAQVVACRVSDCDGISNVCKHEKTPENRIQGDLGAGLEYCIIIIVFSSVCNDLKPRIVVFLLT